MGLLEQTLDRITPQDAEARNKAKARLDQLTMPHWALGRVMDLAIDLAGITGSLTPRVDRRVIVTMAADHGVVAEGVSKYPQEVTCQMVANFVHGGAAINALSRVVGAKVAVVNMGVAGDLSAIAGKGSVIHCPIGPGTQNIARGPAMSREDAIRSVEAGIQIVLDLAAEADLFGTGEMGIGNTTPSSAIVAALTGRTPEQVTGTGTGIDPEQRKHKVSVVEKILQVNRPDPSDGLDVLHKVGGFEIGGIAGLILGAAASKKPVLIDGFISTAGAMIAYAFSPVSAQYMIPAHRSMEQGHAIALEHLGKHPFLDLDFRLGEGTGAALAMAVVEAAVRVLTEVATFEEAAVSHADK
ncbi:MAG: nicotinate-nucleotide--dimethylbenzimidazole phosphoribosyltransferase [Thermodesulfobacteriota bacterium]